MNEAVSEGDEVVVAKEEKEVGMGVVGKDEERNVHLRVVVEDEGDDGHRPLAYVGTVGLLGRSAFSCICTVLARASF